MTAARNTSESLIRRATPEDADAISSVLHQAFGSYKERYTAHAYRATTPTPMHMLARMKEGPVWVALQGCEVVGTVSAVVTEQGCYVRGMGVVPAARGHRIGWHLLETVEQFAKSNQLPRLYLSTTPFLDRAIRLYERYGFCQTDAGPTDLLGIPLFTMAKVLTSKGEGEIL